jgi:stage V sporulation protein SpoVS
VRVRHSNRPGNLAIALRMSNDTAVQYCEVGKVGSSVNHLAVAGLLLVKEAQELVLVLALTVDIPVGRLYQCWVVQVPLCRSSLHDTIDLALGVSTID